MKAEPFRKAVSPDGKLTLEVFEADDYLVGLHGQQWHTHGPLLVPLYGADPKEAALAFFDSVIQDREVICISKRPEKEQETYITHAPDSDVRYMEQGEVLQLRFWSGKEISRHEKTEANQALEPTNTAVTPPAGRLRKSTPGEPAGDRASGARGSP